MAVSAKLLARMPKKREDITMYGKAPPVTAEQVREKFAAVQGALAELETELSGMNESAAVLWHLLNHLRMLHQHARQAAGYARQAKSTK